MINVLTSGMSGLAGTRSFGLLIEFGETADAVVVFPCFEMML